MKQDKYNELDTQVSKEVMNEFKGKIIEHTCQSCGGSGKHQFGDPATGMISTVIVCTNCNGTGKYEIEY